MANQKFNKGDLVRVVKDLGQSMSHFTADTDAIVIGSYSDQYGGSDTKSYTLHLKDEGSCSWYDEHQLTLFESGRLDLLDTWEAEKAENEKIWSDMDWIFSNGEALLQNPKAASVQALADCFGLTNLWGSRGEGVDWYSNSVQTMRLAAPYLIKGDKQGWLDLCEAIQIEHVGSEGVLNDPLKITASTANRSTGE